MPLQPYLIVYEQEEYPAVIYGEHGWCSWSLRIWF